MLSKEIQDLVKENQGLTKDKKRKQRKVDDLICLYNETR